MRNYTLKKLLVHKTQKSIFIQNLRKISNFILKNGLNGIFFEGIGEFIFFLSIEFGTHSYIATKKCAEMTLILKPQTFRNLLYGE